VPGSAAPKHKDIWLVAPNVPLYSIGLISLTNLALTTEKEPNATPQKKRPMQIIQNSYPMRLIATPIRRMRLRM
jgi:hypothetical protein